MKSSTTFPKKHILCGAIGILSLSLGIAASPVETQSQSNPPAITPEVPETISFNRDVRPILSQHCYPCHGPDKAKVEETGGLRLDSFEESTKDRDGKIAINPHNWEESLIRKRIEPKIPELRMPPPDSTVEPLSQYQVSVLKKWIEQGAIYQKHWAFIPPVRPQIPSVSDKSWPINPLDSFVLNKLESNNLKPAAIAPKHTLLRRLSLSLTGLPPTPEEIDRFQKDKSEKAYEKMVDYYLSQPSFGENQARYWLDAVRYGDTHGLHLDNYREIYPYRDWVVRAFNENLSYDQFVKWQLAGDLLPDPSLDQLIASGYVRMNPTTNEGGAIEEEFLIKNTADRTDTTATVFLGLTMACARCHDHKYDPISHDEYYEFSAFFNSTVDPVLDQNSKVHAPVISAPDPEQRARKVQLETQLSKLADTVAIKPLQDWLTTVKNSTPKIADWKLAGPFTAASFELAHKTAFSPENSGSQETTWRDIKVTDSARMDGIVGKENSSAYVKTILTVDKAIDFTLKVGSDDGVKVWLNNQVVHDNPALRGLTIDQDEVVLKLKPGENQLLIKITNGGGPDGLSVSLGTETTRLLATALKSGLEIQNNPEALKKAKPLYLLYGPKHKSTAAYQKLNAEYAEFLKTIPTTLVAKEMPEPRKTYVLRRGEYDQRLNEVSRNVPNWLTPFPTAAAKNRLGLANWILSPENPLPMRVYVNRMWQKYFGAGIVKSSEDFGSQGNWPSNQDLLDWMAVEFRESNFNIKHMHKLIVMSNAFRQSSAVTKEKLAVDPANRLVSRGPRFRLDAEIIRDQALAVSGLLNKQIGGPGVKPYHPPKIWEQLGYESSDTGKYVQDTGDKLYRKSLYLFLKRTSGPPVLAIFDAPSREACSVRRSITNTPMQALAVMNETAFVESARIMAERVIKAKKSQSERIDFALQIAITRKPTAGEQKLLGDFLNQQLEVFQKDPKRATSLLAIGEKPADSRLKPEETAAYTMLCNLILNLDEALTFN